MNAGALSRELRQRAREAGFDAVGIARATALDRDGRALAGWLERGMQAEMSWLERDPGQRADPRSLLTDCRSVIVVAVNYWPGAAEAMTAADRGRVALYARGRDYHKVMGKSLRGLREWLERASGMPARHFVDTGPVLERAWAERSGIGWIGKNANLLTRKLGSWLLLGEILSCAELEPDAGPHTEHCGSCTACLDACPTDAIVREGVVDAQRCISYWSIEHRGAIPQERRDLHGWIFGCDICQEVCPWNQRFAVADADPFGRREELHGLDPREIVRLDEATFRARYSGTALMRAKWEGMRRNACLLLADDPTAIPLLAVLFEDPDPVLRGHAAWSISRIGGAEARAALDRARTAEQTPAVVAEIDAGLKRL